MLEAIVIGVLAGVISSCAGCGRGEPGSPAVDNGTAVAAAHDYDGVVQDFTAGVEHISALHRQTMFSLAGGRKYEWRNLQILFNDSIKAETLDGLHVTDITSVFYYWDEGPWVQYITSSVKKGMLIPARIPDVWIEDDDLGEAEIRLWPDDVLARLKQWNGVIPPADVLILRMPVGPRRCNAQWVIGNMAQVIFIDAVTGDITDWCPAFPIPNVNGPLGEWP